MSDKRHYWSEKIRPDEHHTFQRCWDCGLMRIGRHENGRHWIEWRRDGVRIKSDATPKCEPISDPMPASRGVNAMSIPAGPFTDSYARCPGYPQARP